LQSIEFDKIFNVKESVHDIYKIDNYMLYKIEFHFYKIVNKNIYKFMEVW